MSHITTIDLVVKDLEALKLAAADCGLEFREGQQTHKWYGQFVGDWPLPKDVKESDLGKCDHALHVTGNDRAYEIGVAGVTDVDGTQRYQLRYDFWAGGYGLQEAVGGKSCEKLMQRYGYHAAVRQAEQLGWSLAGEEVQADGTIKLEFEPPAQEFAFAAAGGGW